MKLWRRDRDPDVRDPDDALQHAREAQADVSAASRRAAPVLARLEQHLSTDHIYDAVMATIMDGPR